MEETYKTGQVSFWALFTTQILLDMQEVCASRLDGVKVQHEAVKNIRISFCFIPVVETPWRMRDMPIALSSSWYFKDLYGIHKHIIEWKQKRHPWAQIPTTFANEPLQGVSQQTLKNFTPQTIVFDGQEMPGYTMPPKDINLMLDRNLFYAGTYILNLLTLKEEVAIAMAIDQEMIFAAAHLYNACKQSDLLAPGFAWPEMDLILQHHAGPTFANAIPTTAEAFAARYKHRTCHKRVSATRKTEELRAMKQAPVSPALRRFFKAEESWPRAMACVRARAAKYATNNSRRTATGGWRNGGGGAHQTRRSSRHARIPRRGAQDHRHGLHHAAPAELPDAAGRAQAGQQAAGRGVQGDLAAGVRAGARGQQSRAGLLRLAPHADGRQYLDRELDGRKGGEEGAGRGEEESRSRGRGDGGWRRR